MGIDIFNQEPLMHEWEGCLQIFMEVVEDFPSFIDSDLAKVIKSLGLDLDGAGQALNGGVLEGLARDEVKHLVQFGVLLWEKSIRLYAFLCVVYSRMGESPQGGRYM
jgi:hypothetical protein